MSSHLRNNVITVRPLPWEEWCQLKKGREAKINLWVPTRSPSVSHGVSLPKYSCPNDTFEVRIFYSFIYSVTVTLRVFCVTGDARTRENPPRKSDFHVLLTASRNPLKSHRHCCILQLCCGYLHHRPHAMVKKKTAKANKKKGPKGKKARAKAKLERHWGEQATTAAAPLRTGKSRLLQTASSRLSPSRQTRNDLTHAPNLPTDTLVHPDNGDDDNDSSSDDDDVENACTSLLESIRQKSAHAPTPNNSNPSDGESSSPEHDDDENAMQEEPPSDEEEDDDDAPLLVNDPFTQRFSAATQASNRPSEKNSTSLQAVDFSQFNLHHHNAYKNLELQVSPHLLEHLRNSRSKPPPTQKGNASFDWSKLAHAYLNQARQVLQKRWKVLHPRRRLLDPTQRLLMPALGSYADVLWTNNNDSAYYSSLSLSALHILHHVLTSRNRIQRNNRRLAQQQQQHKSEQIETKQQDDERGGGGGECLSRSRIHSTHSAGIAPHKRSLLHICPKTLATPFGRGTRRGQTRALGHRVRTATTF